MVPVASTTALEGLKRRRHTLVVLLTLVTGAADATGFLALGGAFSSVMTGNMVLLGLSAGHTDAALAVTSGSAIISYVVGVLLGAHVAGAAVPGDPVWPRQVSRALTVEGAVLLVFLLVWEVTLGDRSTGTALALLMIAAAALGIQSSAIQRFGVSGLSSTYLTGTLTTLIGAVAARSPRHTLLPSAQVLSALVVGAGAGALVVEHLPWFSPVLIIGPLVVVVGLSRRVHDGGWSGSARPDGSVLNSPQPSRRGAWWPRSTR
ncbi:DUF1275 domain-containing protein [Rhodococcus antarcticus]|uniref:DUF1275 domain-containing protein n=1 Tax=Rhodococcus antarcticus TaxID=2987751 RepID=A0ABY6P2U5_9NOCA|nr:YoaK family protein [Rhodococcus antarcticus]UZJ25962.1 DUF1275 domain-containing protein [Rhodococcus antarcticus]